MRVVEPNPVGSSTAAPARTRLAWADAAKGFCILLVVLHHTVGKHYAVALPADQLGLYDAWDWVDDTLKPLRMPLFFLLSGIFASSSIDRPWRAVFRKRVGSPYYLYVVWLLIQWPFFAHFTGIGMNRTHGLAELQTDLLFASTGVWYLYALAVYFLLAKLLAPIDPRVVLAGAAALSAFTSELPLEYTNRFSIVQHFVFFALGAYYPQLVTTVQSWRRRGLLPLLAVGYVGALVALKATDLRMCAVTLLVSPLAIALGVRLSMAAATTPYLGATLASIGRRTLPVYVLHVIVLTAVFELLPSLDLPTPLLIAYPLVVTFAIAGVCLGIHAAAMRTPLRWLFVLPGRRGLSERAAA
ncbi:MAG TPA: acyltransferase family protein [Nocardioidaceae bacterium]|nr:acyltransferase family protein [Nocardioidaceae bacterium]